MLKVQEYLLSFSNRFEALKVLNENYGIIVNEYKNDLVVLNYNQIVSPRFNGIVDDCRGLILSYDFKTIISRPFTRFYNFGEGGNLTNNFDFDNSFIYEKIDGSLISLDFHSIKNIWFVHTRKMAYAEGQTSFGNTYRSIILKAFGLDSSLSDKEFTFIIDKYFSNKDINAKDFTWIFEVVSPENRIVKNYGHEYKIYFLGARKKNVFGNNEYLSDISKYKSVYDIDGLNINVPQQYNLKNNNEIEQAIKDLDALDEGFVCFNYETEQRIKIKSPTYLAVHKIRENGKINSKKIAVLVFSNDYEEYLSYFPEDKIYFDKYINAYNIMTKEIMEYHNLYKDIKNQKEFALTIEIIPFKFILFDMRKDKSLLDIFESFTEENKLEMLEMFNDNMWKILINENSKKCKKKK